MSDANETENSTALATTSNAVTAMHRKFNIPGDVVFKATAALPDVHRNAIRAMHAYATEHDLSIAEQSELLSKGATKISEATISLVYRGKYAAAVDNVVKIYADFLKLQEARGKSRRLPFIETDLTKRIWRVCNRAREYQKIGFMFSDAQIGKSEALKEYQRRNNHGSTIYVEIPTGGCLQNFLIKLAGIFKIGTTSRITDIRRRILDSFDDRMLLVVDEAHRSIPGKYVSRKALDTIDFIREVFNERECGVVICATNIFRDEMLDGEHAGILRQTLRRQLCILQLPNRPSKNDLITFAAAHGLPAARSDALELESKTVDEDALGYWLLLMRIGKAIATKRKQDFQWAHVIEADAGQRSLKQMED